MKTIFIPIFQGVEAKNILRTDIFGILKEQKNLRIVLFVPSQQKKEYFEKEFFEKNIHYEIFSNYKQPSLNRLFTFLKYNLLNTKRMDIRRKIWLEENKNYSLYFFKLIFNRIFARKFFRKIVRWFDFKLVKDNNFKEAFDKYNPNLVLLAHLFGDVEISMLRQAKKRGVKTVGLINSWDKLTSRCIIRLLPEKLIVHNKIIREEAIFHADINSQDIEITGIPNYDIFVNSKPKAKDEFYKEMGIDAKKRILLFCPVGQYYSDVDAEMINIISDFQIKKTIPEDAQILVRFPPNDIVDLSKLKNRNLLKFDQPGKRFSAKRGIDWDMDNNDIQHLLDTLYYSSLIICLPSSLSIDAAVFDKPIINIKFRKIRGYRNNNINLFYSADHYRNIIKTGGITIAQDEKELLEWINKYLSNPEINQKNRKKIISEQCWKLDGKSGKRAANFILNLLRDCRQMVS